LEQLVRVVVEEVRRSLQPISSSIRTLEASDIPVAGGDVFCLFYDAPTGLEAVGRQLGMLQDRGVTMGRLQPEFGLPESFQRLKWSDTWPEMKTGDAGRILKNYSSYLVANLSRRALAELASGVTASPQSELIYLALGQKSRVSAVQDPLVADRVTCPGDPIKLAPVQSAIAEQMNQAKDLGIDLIFSEGVFEHLSFQVEHESQAVDALRGFVTLEDVEGFEGREVRVVRGTKVTPLAQDWLRDHGIEVRLIDP